MAAPEAEPLSAMGPAVLLLISSVFLGWMLARRALRESDPLLAGGLAPLLGFPCLILYANTFDRGALPYSIYLFAALALALFALPTDRLEWPPLTRWQWVSLVAAGGAVLIYTLYAQQRFLDSDNWIHEPLIAHYMRGIFPPVHPFFPEIEMHGHYGRDLLMASLTPTGQDPLATVWLLNPLLQLAAFLVLAGSVRSFTGSAPQGITAAVMGFFGVCVGFRVGLVDSFDGNNGVVYALAIALFHLMYRTLELGERRAGPGVWVVAGVTLGVYQLVYETHFGLLLLTGLTLAAAVARTRRVWAGVLIVATLALGLAVTEGGPFTDLARRAGSSTGSASEQNVGQHVTIEFPKDEFLKVLATTADYQRLSAAFRTSLFEGMKPVIRGEGYMSIFDPRFLSTHWLPLFLAPLSLVLLLRRRNLAGLGFWIFGAYAYLTPGLVDFGPVYEWEYFRWEFAAGFGFAVALGVAVAQHLFEGPVPLGWERREGELSLTFGRRFPLWLGCIAVLVASLAAGEKLLNDAIIDVQKRDFKISLLPSEWRIHRPELGIERVDIEAMAWLEPQVLPGDQVLSNLGEESPQGLWPDSVLATRTGAHPAGRARPPRDVRVHAHPNYHRDPVAKAFYATGRVDLLKAAGIDWLYLDPERLEPEVAARLAANTEELRASPLFQDSRGEQRQLYEVRFPEAEALRSEPPFEATLALDIPQEELRAGTLSTLRLTLRNAGETPRRVGWLRVSLLTPEGEPVVAPLEVAPREQPLPAGATEVLELPFVTPLEEGSYELEVSLPYTDSGEPALLERVSLQVDFLARLGAIRPRLDLPDSFEPRRYSRIRLGLTSDEPVRAGDDVVLYYRLMRPGGEYVWELDSIPQKLDLTLEPGVEREYFLDFLSPWESGSYQPELYLKDLSSGRVVPLQGEFRPIHVVEPGS